MKRVEWDNARWYHTSRYIEFLHIKIKKNCHVYNNGEITFGFNLKSDADIKSNYQNLFQKYYIIILKKFNYSDKNR